MRDTPLKSMKNGIGLGTVAGGPKSSREGEGASSDTLCTLNVDFCTILPQPARNQTVNPGSDVAVGYGGEVGSSCGISKGVKVITRACRGELE